MPDIVGMRLQRQQATHRQQAEQGQQGEQRESGQQRKQGKQRQPASLLLIGLQEKAGVPTVTSGYLVVGRKQDFRHEHTL
jgi:hypothetical protein